MTEQKKVYCGECRYQTRQLMEKNYLCEYRIPWGVSWGLQSCAELNKNNDCPDFSPSWWMKVKGWFHA